MDIYRLRTGFRDRKGVIEAQEVDDVYSAVITTTGSVIDGIPEGLNIVWL